MPPGSEFTPAMCTQPQGLIIQLLNGIFVYHKVIRIRRPLFLYCKHYIYKTLKWYRNHCPSQCASFAMETLTIRSKFCMV